MKTKYLSSSCVVLRFITLFILLASLLVLPKALVAVSDAFTIKPPSTPKKDSAEIDGSFTIDQLEYVVLTEDKTSKTGTVSVRAASENISGDIVIPSSVANKGVTYSVTCVQSKAPFSDYRGLTGIVIPDSVTSLGEDAFAGCSSLTNITIPDSVTSIGKKVFFICSSLTSITIPDRVTSIGELAFAGCTSLTNIIIPNSVTEIGENAFEDCHSLTSIIIPGSVTSIEKYAFRKCSSLASVTVGNGVTSIGNSAFHGCSSLTNIIIPNSVTSIGIGAFTECSSLTGIVIPDNVTSLGAGVFAGCSALKRATLGSGVTSIGYWAFYRCGKLRAVYFKGNAPKLPDGNAFSDPSVIYYKPDTTGWTNPWDGRPTKEWSETSNGAGAIFTIGQLEYVVMTEDQASKTGTVSVEPISNAISGDIVIPASVANGEINYSVALIPIQAFSGCTSLTSVTIGNSVTEIGLYAFYGCSSLTEIIVGKNNPNFSCLKGVLFSKDQTTLIQFPVGKKGIYTIPDGVTSMRDGAFYGCSSLASIIIPGSITSIGEAAFIGCSSLTNIVIPDSVTSIGWEAFQKCSSLTSIVIPDSVTEIGRGTFAGCSGLTSIAIPDSVTKIGQEAFIGCGSLTSIVMGNGVTSIGWYAFYKCDKLTDVYFKGNAPKIPKRNAFFKPSVIHYKPGTTGWKNPWDGRPTKEWVE